MDPSFVKSSTKIGLWDCETYFWRPKSHWMCSESWFLKSIFFKKVVYWFHVFYYPKIFANLLDNPALVAVSKFDVKAWRAINLDCAFFTATSRKSSRFQQSCGAIKRVWKRKTHSIYTGSKNDPHAYVLFSFIPPNFRTCYKQGK